MTQSDHSTSGYKTYMHTKVLLSIPRSLLGAIDVVKSEKQISRSAFVRESLLRNLHYYKKYERGRVSCQVDDPKFNCGGPLRTMGVPNDEDSRPLFEDDQTR